MNFPVVEVLKPSVAGRFYPGDPVELKKEVQRYIQDAPVEPSDKPVFAILVPHAGYMFSGPIAGCSFRHVINQNPDTVLFIALSHQGTEGGCIYTGKYYETPLGMVSVDMELVQELVKTGAPFHTEVDPYIQEHSVEVNLPFLQVAFPHAKAASILVTYTEPALCEQMGKKIADVIRGFPDKKVLVIISSDMSHYPDYETANQVDVEMLKSLETLDPEWVYKELKRLESLPARNLRCVMCGSAAMLTAVEAAKFLGANEGRLLYYLNSGDSPFGDHSRVVGYGAFAIYRPENGTSAESETIEKQQALDFTEQDKKDLLSIARKSILAVLLKTPYCLGMIPGRLSMEQGVFVTLKKNGILRGCLGRFEANGVPLHQLVMTIAAESATHDMRFSPVTLDELPHIDIQISVLSPVEPVKDIGEIRIGCHGLKIRGRNPFGMKRTGTLLPQVAIEHCWTVEQFLAATCEKTGIDCEAWKDSQTEIYKYEALIFGDLDYAHPPYPQDV